MKRSDRPQIEIQQFEHYGFKWVDASVFDDEHYGGGYWMVDYGFKIAPTLVEGDDVYEYTIYQSAEVELLDQEGVFRACSFEEGECVVYCGYLDLEDKNFTYNLLLNLGVIVEPFDVDDEPTTP